MPGSPLTFETRTWQRLPSTSPQLENAGTPEAPDPAATQFDRLGKQKVSFQIPTAQLTGAQQTPMPTPPKDPPGGMKQPFSFPSATLDDKPRSVGNTFGGASFAFEPSTQTTTGNSAPSTSTAPNRFVRILLDIVWDLRAKFNDPESGVLASKFANELKKKFPEVREALSREKSTPRT